MKMVKKSMVVMALLAMIVAFSSPIAAKETTSVNINTASVEELTQLKGVGKKYATRIVAYREENGGFKTPEEIINVRGIGNKILEKNKEAIVVETPTTGQ